MDLQIPLDKLEDDVMSQPEKDDVSLYITFSSLHQTQFMMSRFIERSEISCPQHVKVPLLKYSIAEPKRSIEDLEDNLFGGAGKKRILGPDELENPGYMSLKMKNICALDGEFGSYGSEDWTETEGKKPLLLVGERFITLQNGFGSIPKFTFTDNSRWLRSRKFGLGAKVVQPTSNGENIKEGTSEPFVVKDNRGDLSYKKQYSPFLNDEIWHLMKIAKEGQIHKRPSPKEIHTVTDLWMLFINESSVSLFKEEHSRKESLRAMGEYPQNHCKALNESKLLPCVNKEKQMNITGNKFSLEKTKDTMAIDLLFQHKRKEIAQHVSFVLVICIMFAWLLFDTWPSFHMQFQPLHEERGPVSIWASLLGLFGFMVFVWAVAITVLVGVPFSRLQSSVLIFWVIWMHLKSASSISAVFVPMLGIIFLGVFARGKV